MLELLHTTLRYFSLVNQKVDGKQLREAAITATSPEIGEKVMTYGQQLFQEGQQKGKQEEALRLTLRLLERRFGAVESSIAGRIRGLPLERLEALIVSAFDFKQNNDVAEWLAKYARP